MYSCRLWLKISAIFLFIVIIFVNPRFSNAVAAATKISVQNVVKVEVTGDNVNLRDTPSAKGKVLGQANNGNSYIAEKTLITDSKDGSKWYQIIYEVGAYADEFYKPFNNTSYISSKYVKVVPLSEHDRGQLEWFAQDRPVRYHTGDTIIDDISINEAKLVPIKAPMTVFLEPRKNSEQKTFPKGTEIFVFNGGDMGGLTPYDAHIDKYPGTMYYYEDVNGENWVPVSGENRKVIGWLKGIDLFDVAPIR
jgi:hypothetical protein